jgi:hypothetical protein
MVIEYMAYGIIYFWQFYIDFHIRFYTDDNLLFLITKAMPFAWSDTDFLYYSLYKGVLVTIGSVLFPMLMFATKLRAQVGHPWFLRAQGHILLQDALMIVVGTSASIVVNCLLSFSNTTAQVWCVTCLVVVTAAMSPGLRSLNSRMVKADETGIFEICFHNIFLKFNFQPAYTRPSASC